MHSTGEETQSRQRPLLLRFLLPLQPPAFSIVYDRAEQLNMLVEQRIPAVHGGADVKTMTRTPGED